MAAITYNTVRKWILDPSTALSIDQLRELSALFEQRRADAEAHEDKVRQALQQAADSLGIPVEELVKRTAPVTSNTTRKTVDGVRRPFMNPHELMGDAADEVRLYFLANKRMPSWAEKLMKAGWRKRDFRYDEIEERMKSERMVCKHDPVAIYKKRVTAEMEAPRPSRIQRRK